MTMRINVDDIVDYDYISKATGQSKQAVSNWIVRHEEFADAILESSTVHVLFDWRKARKWLRQTGRLQKGVA